MHMSADGTTGGGVPPHVELQREVDSMQAVYTQQRRELEVLARSFECDVQGLREQLQKARIAHAEAAEGCGLERVRRVRWRLAGIRNLTWEVPDPAQYSLQEFQLPECPGVQFRLSFFPFGGAAVASSASPPAGAVRTRGVGLPGWRLALKVSGFHAEGLELEAQLSVAIEMADRVGSTDIGSGWGSAVLGDFHDIVHVVAAECRQEGCAGLDNGRGHCPHAEVQCEGAWPRQCWEAWQASARGDLVERSTTDGCLSANIWPDCTSEDGDGQEAASLVLCANLAVLGWESPVLVLQSSWIAADRVAESSEEEDDIKDEDLG